MRILVYLLTLTAQASAVTIIFGPSVYLSEADSPFYQGIVDGSIYLEDFEDQSLNTPFVNVVPDLASISLTYRDRAPDAPDGAVRGVDGDDGLIDGNGFAGDSWVRISLISFGAIPRHIFEFSGNEFGVFPTFVGIVITHVENLDLTVDLGLRDALGNIIEESVDEYNPRLWAAPPGTPNPNDSTLRHRFIGFHAPQGISEIFISNAIQIDHLQYGYAIPEPSSILLLLTASLSILALRRR